MRRAACAIGDETKDIVDSDWAGCMTTRRSTNGRCIMAGDICVKSNAWIGIEQWRRTQTGACEGPPDGTLPLKVQTAYLSGVSVSGFLHGGQKRHHNTMALVLRKAETRRDQIVVCVVLALV